MLHVSCEAHRHLFSNQGIDLCPQDPAGIFCDRCIDRTGFLLLAVICPHANPVPGGTERDFPA